jgi:hypothetical protein
VTAAPLLACLLGPPRVMPMARLLDLDQREFNRRVGALLHTDVTATQEGGVRCAARTRQGEEVDA